MIRNAFLSAVLLLSLPSTFAVDDCIVCTNVPTKGMIKKDKDCTKSRVSKGKKCNESDNWVKNGYCQLSCFEAGRGFEGVVCCGAEGPPVSSPTESPVDLPTEPPVDVPTGSPVASPTNDHGEGEWGEIFDMSLIPIHTMLLSDGQVLSYGTNNKGDQGGDLFYEVWDHSKGVHNAHKLLEHRTETDIFCSSLNFDTSTGNVIIMGGDGRNIGNKGGGINTVLEYIVETEEVRLHPRGNMHYARWYATSINLPNGDIFVIGGRDDDFLGSDIPEVWSPDTGYRALPGASVPAIADNREKNYYYYPHTYVNSKAEIIVIMPRKGEQVYLVDVEGDGIIEQIGKRPFQAHARTPSIMFRTDLVAFLDDEGNIWVGDISDSSAITWKKEVSLGQGRTNGSMALLPDGRVAIVGGADNNQVNQGTVEDAVLDIQIWDPEYKKVMRGINQENPRLYHSTSLILPDGSVMSAGGGSPGPVTNLNGQLYHPEYMHVSRPAIMNCPSSIESGKIFEMAVDDTSSVAKVTATKSGSSSHTRNCDTRWLDLEFDILDATTLRVHTEERNIMIGGVWMVNVVDVSGIPSEGRIVGVDMAVFHG